VASAFAMSEATLRRKLADEGTSLSTILVDARMSFALTLLQSTTQPVTQIALAVGYQTPSQFAVRFRDRFGFVPTSVRGHRRPAPDANALGMPVTS
jgi:AraC-like DNA-binding protein